MLERLRSGRRVKGDVVPENIGYTTIGKRPPPPEPPPPPAAPDPLQPGRQWVFAVAQGMGTKQADMPPDLVAGFARRAEELYASPRAGLQRETIALARDFATATKTPLAPGDEARALAGAYKNAKTFEIVREELAKLTPGDAGLEALQIEAKIGSKRFLDMVRAQDPGAATAIVKASGLDSRLGVEALRERDVTAKAFAAFQENAAQYHPLTQRAVTTLQLAMGYGTPIVDELGRPILGRWMGEEAAGYAAAVTGLPAGRLEQTRLYKFKNNQIRAGMLSGFALPNASFYANNNIGAPFLVYSTLGPMKAAISTFSPESWRITKALSGDPAYRAMRFNGTYTYGQLADVVASNGLTRSQASAELGTSTVEQLVNWADDASAGRFRSHMRALAGQGRGKNFFTEMSEAFDAHWRQNVFALELTNGATVEQAIRAARDSLFDYGRMTGLEKSLWGRITWFWNFRRNNYLTLLDNFRRHPQRVGALAAIQNAASETVPGEEDTFLTTVSYAEGSPMYRMVTDEQAQVRYALNGPPIPGNQALEDLVNGTTELALGLQEVADGRPGEAGLRAFDAALALVNPGVQKWAGVATGRDLSRGGTAELSQAVDSRLLRWWAATGHLDTAIAWFDMEEGQLGSNDPSRGGNFLPERQTETGTGNYSIRSQHGRQMWQLFKLALWSAGMERAASGYAPALAGASELAGQPPQVVDPRLGNAPGGSRWQQAMQALGLLTVTPEPTLSGASERNKALRTSEALPPD